jgi:hypothetical protein
MWPLKKWTEFRSFEGINAKKIEEKLFQSWTEGRNQKYL